MRRFGPAAAMILATSTIASIGMATEPVRRLKGINRADLERTKVLGTGCSWSKTSDGPTMFAATDDVAVIKPGSKVVRLTPDRDAKDMFPFTYNRWVAAGINVEVIETGRAKMIATELIKTQATLRVTMNGRTSQMAGVLNCGS